MTTKPRTPTTAELELVKARAEIRSLLGEIEQSFAVIRKAAGLPARTTATTRGKTPVEMKRIEAMELMKSMGCRIDHSDIKHGAVRIVGPSFSAEFFDIADFDGTTRNAIN
ncbi:hypothetical protein [Variovorax sp. UMC13]|uniref:hypothetical protein n=1 Tax=Variovorax sp. UMC13 TaxID=1862326 RepID=UPI0016004A82|nr:hypothetical protein [Variovorax sp. UMC13]MBB1601065.1 hypothetical protein [Variovorax sp. UMC13]